MRASRLLRILLVLQNRGLQTSSQLASELEVSTRTILRDVDAMTEAGLPIIVHQGNRGGIELGFDYRTRLTGLAQDEARALGLILSATSPMVAALGLENAAALAQAKLVESLPDGSRDLAADMMARFQVEEEAPDLDVRVRAMAKAVEGRNIVRVRFTSDAERVVHPSGLRMGRGGWAVLDEVTGEWIGEADWGRLNVSGKRFG